MWIDSHCHLAYDDYGHELCDVVLRAADAGIGAFVVIFCKLDEINSLEQGRILKSVELPNDICLPKVFCSIGIHPHEAEGTLNRMSLQKLYDYLKLKSLHDGVIALGEMGYDFYYSHSDAKSQRDVFEVQLCLAEDLGLPVVVHSRSADIETINHIRMHPKVRGVIHCFSGDSSFAKAALDLGFYISLSGIVTFPKAQEIRDAVSIVPLDRVLLETDAPFLSPVPLRGKRNEPSYMLETAKVVAKIKSIDMDQLRVATFANFKNLFFRASFD